MKAQTFPGGRPFDAQDSPRGDSLTAGQDELTGFLQRASYALGPLGVGIILDLLDAATFGPIGIFFGAIVGSVAGWYLGKYEGLCRSLRIALAISAAVYMTTPFTEAVPAATILVLLSRFFVGPHVETAN